MALSYVHYSGNGSNKNFSVPFDFIDHAHIKVSVDGAGVPFTWLNASTIQTTITPANGTVVEVRRHTPRDARLVDFVDGAVLTEMSLDRSSKQSFFLAQEAFDAAGASLILTEDGHYSAGGRRITNVGDPVGSQNVATKGWVESSVGSPVVQAQAAAAAANTSATLAANAAAAADASASTAMTRRDEAEAARDAAAQARTGAETARSGAEVARDAADLARQGAEAVLAQLGTERDEAVAARQGAEAARDTAVLAKTDAEGARDTVVAANTAAQHAKTDAEAASLAAVGAKDSALTSASSALAYRDTAIGARDAAILARDAALGYRDTAEVHKVAAGGSAASAARDADDAAAARAYCQGVASSITLPPMQPGDAGKSLRVKSTEDGYELRAPAEVRADIGAAPTSHTHGAHQITSGTLALIHGGTGANNGADAINNLGGERRRRFARMRRSSDQGIPNLPYRTYVKVAWNVDVADPNGMTNTANGTMTIPLGARAVRVTTCVMWKASPDGRRRVEIQVGGKTVAATQSEAAGENAQVVDSGVYPVSGGEGVQVLVWQWQPAGVHVDIVGGTEGSSFSMEVWS